MSDLQINPSQFQFAELWKKFEADTKDALVDNMGIMVELHKKEPTRIPDINRTHFAIGQNTWSHEDNQATIYQLKSLLDLGSLVLRKTTWEKPAKYNTDHGQAHAIQIALSSFLKGTTRFSLRLELPLVFQDKSALYSIHHEPGTPLTDVLKGLGPTDTSHVILVVLGALASIVHRWQSDSEFLVWKRTILVEDVLLDLKSPYDPHHFVTISVDAQVGARRSLHTQKYVGCSPNGHGRIEMMSFILSLGKHLQDSSTPVLESTGRLLSNFQEAAITLRSGQNVVSKKKRGAADAFLKYHRIITVCTKELDDIKGKLQAQRP
jgi:hypothetical protein